MPYGCHGLQTAGQLILLCRKRGAHGGQARHIGNGGEVGLVDRCWRLK